MKRTTYLLKVRAKPGVDEIRALRAWLKIGLRTFGLKCVGITPKDEEKAMVDARKYAPKRVGPDQVRDGSVVTRIINTFEEERYGNLMLELETGSQFRMNEGNTQVLIRAWGHDTDSWIGQELELFLGTYKDWNSDPIVEKETVRVKAISPPKTPQNGSAPASKPLPPSRTATSPKDDMDDAIPF